MTRRRPSSPRLDDFRASLRDALEVYRSSTKGDSAPDPDDGDRLAGLRRSGRLWDPVARLSTPAAIAPIVARIGRRGSSLAGAVQARRAPAPNGCAGRDTIRHARIALIGETEHDAREVMVEGVSGLLAVHRHDERPRWIPTRRRLEWPIGAVAAMFSAENYRRVCAGRNFPPPGATNSPSGAKFWGGGRPIPCPATSRNGR